MTRLLTFAAAILLVSCATQARTEVIVSIDADGTVRARATGLRVEIRGGPGTDPTTWGAPMVRSETLVWPVQVGIIPENGDTSRGFEVRAVATGASGDLAEARVVSTFEPQRTLSLPLILEGSCIGMTCPATEACRAGACAAPLAPPTNIDAAPVDFSGMYTVSVTAGANGCNFPGWTVGAVTMNVPVMGTQALGDANVTVDIGGAPGLYLDLIEHSHTLMGVAYGNHLTATLVGSNSTTTMGCTYTVNAILNLDLVGDTVTGSIEAYGVSPDTAACVAILGCSTIETVTGTRM